MYILVNWGDFDPRRHLTMFGRDIFECHNLRENAPGLQEVETKNAIKHPMVMLKHPTVKNYPV